MDIAVGFTAEAEGKASPDRQWGNSQHCSLIFAVDLF